MRTGSPTTPDEVFRIAFVGIPQMGKTSLICAWYAHCVEVYSARPDVEDSDTASFLRTYELLNETGEVPVTAPGDWSRVKLDCYLHGHEFRLVLCDFSGEDVVRGVDADLHGVGGSAGDGSTLESRVPVVSELLEADWIVLVQDPALLLGGSPANQNAAMKIAKALPCLGGDSAQGITARTTLYLSHQDVRGPEVFDQAESVLLRFFEGDESARPRIVRGAAIREASEHEKRLASPSDATSPATFINDVMTSLSTRGSQRSRSLGGGKLRLIALVGVGLVALAVWQGMRGHGTDSAADWPSHLEDLSKLETRVGRGRVTYESANTLLGDVQQWEEQASQFGPERLAETEDRLQDLRQTLRAIPQPKGLDAVEARISTARKKHRASLQWFYEEVQQEAKDAALDTRTWTRPAREEWKRVEEFATTVLGGIEFELTDCWLETPKWWSTGGSAQIQLELWISDQAVCPFHHETEHVTPDMPRHVTSEQLASLSTHMVGPTPSGDAHYYKWTGGWRGNRKLYINDFVWLRLFEDSFDDEEFSHHELRVSGPDLLGWFGQVHALSTPHGDVRLRVGVRNLSILDVPTSVSKAFEANGGR